MGALPVRTVKSVLRRNERDLYFECDIRYTALARDCAALVARCEVAAQPCGLELRAARVDVLVERPRLARKILADLKAGVYEPVEVRDIP